MAKRFQFRLEPILDLRARAEQRAQEQLAETISARTQGREMLQSAQDLVAEADAAARELAAQPLLASQLVAQQAWRERLERHRLAAGRQLEEAEHEVVLSRDALVEAHRRRATLDRLREVREAAHQAEVARRDAAEVDEIALQQHARRRAA